MQSSNLLIYVIKHRDSWATGFFRGGKILKQAVNSIFHFSIKALNVLLLIFEVGRNHAFY